MDPFTIVAGIVAIVTTAAGIASGAAQNAAIGDAKQEQFGLAMLARDDEKRKEKMAQEFTRETFNYKKRMEREALNKNQLSVFTNSLNEIDKSDKNMTNFILSLYGNNPAAKRTGI